MVQGLQARGKRQKIYVENRYDEREAIKAREEKCEMSEQASGRRRRRLTEAGACGAGVDGGDKGVR